MSLLCFDQASSDIKAAPPEPHCASRCAVTCCRALFSHSAEAKIPTVRHKCCRVKQTFQRVYVRGTGSDHRGCGATGQLMINSESSFIDF